MYIDLIILVLIIGEIKLLMRVIKLYKRTHVSSSIPPPFLEKQGRHLSL